ncbi:uncharacterized protein LOC132166203 [Corylus avellana]|uniref:uncharacterized protein LOC132166203 n=1 Tax=Corylus avellana TaxID=13451 RepID=UPI001E2353CC|nr:uncharacterized protein LOC132166203 [Corylus avellana]
MVKLFPSFGRCLQRLFCYGSDNPWNPLKGLPLVHRLSSSIPRQTLVGRRTARNRVLSYSPWPLGSQRCFSHNNTSEDEDGISSSPCLMTAWSGPQQLNKLAVAGQKIVTLDYPKDVAFDEILGSSSPGWIAVTNAFDGDIVLTNPFTEKIGKVYQATPPPVVRLPPTSTMPQMDIIIEHWRRDCIENELRIEISYDHFISNIVWSSNPMSPDCTVMVVYGPDRDVAFCRPRDKSWSDACLDLEYRDSYTKLLVYSTKSKLFYAQRFDGGTFEGWDLQQASCPKMIHRLDHTNYKFYPPTRKFEYLVESLGDILLVARYLGPPTQPPSKTHRFDVFKLDFQQQTMERVECLGDRVLFVCMKHSFSVSAQDFPELNPNSIYFTHDDMEYWPESYQTSDGYTSNREDYDIGFYCLEDHSITPLYDIADGLCDPGCWVIPKPPYM